jgi:hypothetical protein
MIQFLDEKKGKAKVAPLTSQERSELEKLRGEVKRLQEKDKKNRKGSDASGNSANEGKKKGGKGSSSEEDVSLFHYSSLS